MKSIYKIEKFIPKAGNPVMQVSERLEVDGKTVLLDPRNPTLEEMQAAEDSFSVSQQATIQQLESRVAAMQREIDETKSALEAANQAQVTWDVRIVNASAFVDRLSSAEMMAVFSSEDPVKQSMANMLNEYSKPENDWPIMLDSPEFQEAVGYLVQSGTISQERADQLLRDSSRSESYTATNLP